HRAGAAALNKTLENCMELGIPQVSVYMLSTENLNREPREVEELFKLYYEYLKKWEKGEGGLLDKYQVHVRFAGDLGKLPPQLRELSEKIMAKTAKYQRRFLNLMIAYGSQFELMEVMKKIAQKAIETGHIEITAKDVEANLMVPVPLDLVVRTGGTYRLSNFMLWQASYAELYITKTLWPDFDKAELMKAVRWYSSVKRNFGK
ncbi:MAG: polyprenyl diphosphate synthase, partial [Candidatus Aenigmarchaeota archaeon]|nr:polyprenyl diphosphate synthase [Candidatus Aenigmarchaeota archaeon]